MGSHGQGGAHRWALARSTGQKKADIQHAMILPYTTIQTTMATYQSSTTGTSSPRIGRPEILSDADKRYILSQNKRDPFYQN